MGKFLNESKKTEEMGINLLRKYNIEEPEPIIKRFAEGDESNNQKNILFMALMYVKYDNIDAIISVFNEYNELELMRRIKPLQYTQGLFFIGEKRIDSFTDFANYVHGIKQKRDDTITTSTPIDKDAFDAVDEPTLSVNGFDIYDADDVDKCIKYSQGGLTGGRYTFCIGAYGSNNLYQSHRDTSTSTFYFIVDTKRIGVNDDGSPNLDDPLHIVVYDAQINDRVSLTDGNNNTGTIAEPFGTDVKKYINYLKSNGVPVELFVNRPKTEQEIEDDRIIGKRNGDLEWFIDLPMHYKIRYVGRGHLLSNEQFDYLNED
jgi:hypothetical protein